MKYVLAAFAFLFASLAFANPGALPVHVITAGSTYTVNSSTDNVIVSRPTDFGDVTINLDSSPSVGDNYLIKDGWGSAGCGEDGSIAYNLSIEAGSNTIEGSDPVGIGGCGWGERVIWDGTQWDYMSEALY